MICMHFWIRIRQQCATFWNCCFQFSFEKIHHDFPFLKSLHSIIECNMPFVWPRSGELSWVWQFLRLLVFKWGHLKLVWVHTVAASFAVWVESNRYGIIFILISDSIVCVCISSFLFCFLFENFHILSHYYFFSVFKITLLSIPSFFYILPIPPFVLFFDFQLAQIQL